GFENGIRRLIYQFEIDDTVANRQRAMSKIFEGRAAARLDIEERHELVNKSRSESTGDGRALTQNADVTEGEPPTPGSEPSPPPSVVERPSASALTAGPRDPQIAHLDLTPRSAAGTITSARDSSSTFSPVS